LSGKFVVGPGQCHSSLVHFDSWNYAKILQNLHQRGTVAGLLEERLVEHDDAADVFCHLGSGLEQQLSVVASVVLHILQADLVEALSNSACTSKVQQ